MKDLNREQISPEVRDHIRQEYRRGLTADGCIGLHGTSLNALHYLLANGVLAGETRVGRFAGEKGDVYFYRLAKRGIIFPVDLEEATWYAQTNAMRHFLYAELDLEIQKRQDEAMIDFLIDRRIAGVTDPMYRKLFERRGWDPQEIEKLLELGLEQRGIIVGIREEVGEKYSISERDLWGGMTDDPRIITAGRGLPFTEIIGIRALGEAEKAFLDDL